MAQNAISGKLKLKIFWESIFPDILKLHDSIQDPFSPPVLSAFRHPCSGHHEFCVKPFELCNGPFTFQQLMESVLVGLSGSRYNFMCLDDAMIKQYLENLQEVSLR